MMLCFETCLQFYISSASTLQHFLHHGSTLSPCHIMLHCYVLPPTHHLVQPHPPSLLLLLAQPEVGCRLPLIWVSVIQFSGRYKPAQCHTPPPPFPPLSWAQGVSATTHGAKGTNTHTSPTPSVPSNCTEFPCLNLKAANLAVELLCWIADQILIHRL